MTFVHALDKGKESKAPMTSESVEYVIEICVLGIPFQNQTIDFLSVGLIS